MNTTEQMFLGMGTKSTREEYFANFDPPSEGYRGRPLIPSIC
jgi:hypothetical protein